MISFYRKNIIKIELIRYWIYLFYIIKHKAHTYKILQNLITSTFFFFYKKMIKNKVTFYIIFFVGINIINNKFRYSLRVLKIYSVCDINYRFSTGSEI